MSWRSSNAAASTIVAAVSAWSARSGARESVASVTASVQAVDEPDRAAHGGDPPARAPHFVREDVLREAQQGREPGGRDRLDRHALGDREVAGEKWQCAPAEREPGRAVAAAAEELEVVGDDDEAARPRRTRAATASTRSRPRLRSRSPLRSSDGEPRRGRRGISVRSGRPRARRGRARRLPARAGTRAASSRAGARRGPGQAPRRHDVAEVPRCPRRVEQGHVVAPPPGPRA